MFNFCLAMEASFKASEFNTKHEYRDYLDLNCVDKKVISIDKVIYTFEDKSFLCCDGNDIKARPAGHDVSNFCH